MIASDLAMLTYTLGVLILALPVPYRPLKSWGPKLIIDSITAAVLISSITLIISAGDIILNELGIGWDSFYLWLSSLTAGLSTAFLGLTYASTLIRSSSYSFLSAPLGIAASLLTTAFSSVKLIYLLSSFIYSFRDKLGVIGVLLYSLPFRMGKGVGAFLIAASVVMYVGFPLMPAFVNTFQTVTSRTPVHINPTIKLWVRDVDGNPLPYPILYFYSSSGGSTPVGVILGDERGEVIIGDSLDTLPKNFTLSLMVGFSGYYVRPEPPEVSSSIKEAVLKVVPAIYSNGVTLFLPKGSVLINSSVTNKTIGAFLELPNSGKAVISAVSEATVNQVIVDGERMNCSWMPYTWKSLGLKVSSVNLPEGKVRIKLVFDGAPYPKPSVNEKRLVYLDTVMDIVTALLTTAVSLVYSLIFLPGVYLVILTSITAGLSRALGGSKVRLI